MPINMKFVRPQLFLSLLVLLLVAKVVEVVSLPFLVLSLLLKTTTVILTFDSDIGIVIAICFAYYL